MPATQVGPPRLRPHCVPVAQSTHAPYQPVSGFPLDFDQFQLTSDFNDQGNERTTVSGRRTNPFGAIGTPLPQRE